MPTPKTTPLPIDSLDLQTLPEKGPAPTSRLKDAKSAHELYTKLKEADSFSSANRASIQAMFDGEPPYNDDDLVATGQGFRTNVNFDEASNLLEQSMSAYVDMLHSVETLVTVKTTHGEPTERTSHEEVIAEEISRAIRSWPLFNYNFLANCRNFIADGVSVSYFENELDWRWRVAPLAEFFFPRKTQASEGELEVACSERSFQSHQLFSYIREEKVAENLGWNVPAVRKAIMKSSEKTGVLSSDWEAVQNELKNNDLYCGATSSEIKVVHMWVQEFDQTVSHYIFLAESPEEFLYKKLSRFDSMEQALVFFTYGIGTNGYYHSIRGLGYKVFPQVQVSNRLRCQMIDSAMMSSSIMIQPQTQEATEDLSMVYYGPFAVITPDVKILERASPNLSQSAIPVLNDMSNQIQSRSGQYTQNALNDTREKTKFEVATQLEAISKLSVTSMNLFYEPWQRLLREVVRRLTRVNYIDMQPGGKEAAVFRRRCVARGVPEAAINALDIETVRVVRAVGAGSQAARQMVFSELDSVSSSMDPKGRNTYLRERIASRVGWDQVDKYLPAETEGRPIDDDRFAEIENNIMASSAMPMTVRPNDNHVVHLRSHVNALDGFVQAMDAGQTTIEQATPAMSVIHAHAVLHIELAAGDVVAGEELPALNQRLQQVGEIVYNGVEHMKRLQRENQGATGAPGPSLEEQKASQELMRRIVEHQAKLKMLRETHQLKLTIEREKAQQKRLLDDATTAAKISRQ
jgi:hypothetical protein